MKWTRFRIKTTTEAEDIIISDLYDIGLDGAQIEDKLPLTPLEKEQMFVDIMPESEENDGVAYLSFFVEQDEAGKLRLNDEELTPEEVSARIENVLKETAEFMDIGDARLSVDETEDLDWINNWKQYFHSFRIDDILVIPSWEEESENADYKYKLRIDPGTAFGTGMHETTQLCIRQLRKYVNDETELLDVGCGSGILSILSLMFGAKHALGTDLDPCAVSAVADNCEKNNIDTSRLELIIGNIITDNAVKDKAGIEKYDIVVANILADVLIPLTPVIYDNLKKGGIYITSGIIEGKEKDVCEAAERAGLKVIEVTSQGEWRSVTAKKEI